MTHLDIAKKEGREVFDKQFGTYNLNDIAEFNGKIYSAKEIVKEWLTSHERAIEIALLEDLVEEAEKNRAFFIRATGGTTDSSVYAKGVLAAIVELITKYQDRIKRLKS